MGGGCLQGAHHPVKGALGALLSVVQGHLQKPVGPRAREPLKGRREGLPEGVVFKCG